MKVHLTSLGCKLNESEIESWARQLRSMGHEIVDDARLAELVILNTCTVTSEAARKSRNSSRHLARLNPEARIVLTGCYASIAPDQAGLLPNVELVVPNRQKDILLKIAGEKWDDLLFKTLEAGCRLPEASSGKLKSDSPSVDTSYRHHTRAFVKIEDGCNMACSYCIIPIARGRERSRPAGDIVQEVKELSAKGCQEIILTGVQISDYEFAGDKRGGLLKLVRRILSETNIPRLRLTSIAPWDLTDRMLELFENSRVCRHLHLSLQSGSDSVLRRMRRPYSTLQFADAMNMARQVVPGVGITTDVIVGFPGETEYEFEESLSFLRAAGFARIHVFPYSRREGTAAASLPAQINDDDKRVRSAKVQAVAEASAARFAAQFSGCTLPVLWENKSSDEQENEYWSGYTDNYIRVMTENGSNLQNVITETRLSFSPSGTAFGEILDR